VRRPAVLAWFLFLAVPAAWAESPQGQLALYTVKPDREAEFAEGYARHLQWHLANADPWAWYVWAIVTGERRGRYVGGSFGHAWADLDRRPHPAEDRADHARNIDRQLEHVGSRMVERREDLGGQLPLLETSPYLAAFEMQVRPGSAAAFEDALRALAKLRGPLPAHGWLEIVNGDEVPAYVLLVPLASLADLEQVRYAGLGARGEERGAAREATARALSCLASVRSEAWSFRPDLSTCLLAKTGCVGVASGAEAPRP
jgi:hypothetical protein